MYKLAISGALVAGLFVALSARAESSRSLDPQTTDPTQIMRAAFGQFTPDQSVGRMKMTIRDQGGTRERTMSTRSLRFEGGRKSLILIEAPADVRNTGFLSIDRHGGSTADEQWLYLPKLRRTSRVASAGRADPFLGSDFSYSDLAEQDPADFNWTMQDPSVRVGDEECWLIDGTPKNDTVRQATGYAKSQMWVSKSKVITVQLKATRLKDDKTKYLKVSDVRKVGGFWAPFKLQMRTLQGAKLESETIIDVLSLETSGVTVADSDFTQARLERGL
jgi:Outer membrane lipoprotein-sorting protein